MVRNTGFVSCLSPVQSRRLRIQTLEVVCGAWFRGIRAFVSQTQNIRRSGFSAGFDRRPDSGWRNGFLSGLGRTPAPRERGGHYRRGGNTGNLARSGRYKDWRVDDLDRGDPRSTAAMLRCAQGSGAGSRVGANSESRHRSGEFVQCIAGGGWRASAARPGCRRGTGLGGGQAATAAGGVPGGESEDPAEAG